jgi:tetratricopeptide (TPR) repeat protein
MQNLLYNPVISCCKLSIFKRAFDVTRRIMKIETDQTRAMLQGNAYGNMGMFKQAVKLYKQAIRIDPYNAEACFNLGNAYSKLGMFKEAVRTYKETLRIKSNDAKVYYSLGKAYSKLGMYNAAITTTRRTIQIKPDMSKAHKNLGIFYGTLGRYKEAKKSLKEALKIEPSNTNARYNLALVCLELHDRNSALEEYRILKDLSPKTASKLSKLLHN